MHILFVSPYVPSKIRVRSYNLIKNLVDLGHQVTLATLLAGADDAIALPEMEAICYQVLTATTPRWRPVWNCLRALPGSEPLQYAYSRSPAMEQLLCQALAENHFDIAHIEHLRGACFSPALRGLPVIFDSVDSISLLFERTAQASPRFSNRMMARLDLRRTEKFEAQMLSRFDSTLISSSIDADHILHLSGPQSNRERLWILPNAVDLHYFYPDSQSRKANTIVFTGKMSYHANVAAALYLGHEIMPRVWQRKPSVVLWIVGKDPTPPIQALTQDERIVVTGFVPDLRPYLWQATLSASPIQYGAGTQFKILEALASGTPVLTSKLACEGLPVTPGQHLMSAEDPEEFVHNILDVLDSPEKQVSLAREGRRYVEEHHSWRSQTRRLVDIYQKAIEEYHTNGRK